MILHKISWYDTTRHDTIWPSNATRLNEWWRHRYASSVNDTVRPPNATPYLITMLLLTFNMQVRSKTENLKLNNLHQNTLPIGTISKRLLHNSWRIASRLARNKHWAETRDNLSGRGAGGATMGGVDRPRRTHVAAEIVANRFWTVSKLNVK